MENSLCIAVLVASRYHEVQSHITDTNKSTIGDWKKFYYHKQLYYNTLLFPNPSIPSKFFSVAKSLQLEKQSKGIY